MSLTFDAARELRDGGIDACAALNHALAYALAHLPTEAHAEVKLSIGRAMAAVLDETVHQAMNSFPELEPNEEAWLTAVKNQLKKRAAALAAA